MKPDLSDAQHQNDLLGNGGPSTTASEQPVDADPEKGQMSPPQEKHEEQVRAITGFKVCRLEYSWMSRGTFKRC